MEISGDFLTRTSEEEITLLVGTLKEIISSLVCSTVK
jgi:hypothetical protein